MNKIQKTILGLGTLALVVLGGVSQAEAYKGDPSVKGPNYTEERHENMEKAFENKDYANWKNLMEGRGRVTEVVNEKNFTKFVEAHDLALKGDLAGAQKIRQELGLGLRDGSGQGMKNGLGHKMGNRGGVFLNR